MTDERHRLTIDDVTPNDADVTRGLTLSDFMVRRLENMVTMPGARQFCAMKPIFSSEMQTTSSPPDLCQLQLGM